MSRGLGRVERFILSWLAGDKRHEASLWRLSHAVAGSVDCPACADLGIPFRAEFADATYKTVARAVRSLERKGFVRTVSEHVDGQIERPVWGVHGGVSRRTMVQLSVETKDISSWIQRLPCQYDDAESAA